MEPESSSPYSQQPAFCPYPQLDYLIHAISSYLFIYLLYSFSSLLLLLPLTLKYLPQHPQPVLLLMWEQSSQLLKTTIKIVFLYIMIFVLLDGLTGRQELLDQMVAGIPGI